MKQTNLNIRTEDTMIELLKEVSEQNCESYSSYIRNLIRQNIKRDFPNIFNKYY
mgnify:CR=1 FL=1